MEKSKTIDFYRSRVRQCQGEKGRFANYFKDTTANPEKYVVLTLTNVAAISQISREITFECKIESLEIFMPKYSNCQEEHGDFEHFI